MSSILDQRRIIRDPDNPQETKIPSMPLVIALDNGIVGEATSIRGVMSFIIGAEYLDAEDGEIEWYHRLFMARKECMKALGREIHAVVYDCRKGIIANNYAADPEDPDYEVLPDEGESLKIRIENDRLFILSLLKIGTFILLEREDSYQLRPHPKWDAIRKDPTLQNCKSCLHPENGGKLCPVYSEDIWPENGKRCGSYAFLCNEHDKTEKKEYIEIAKAYDMDELIEVVGQEWNLK
ncbi:hypothetical protein [Geosporobacter ferrireducens]|uniref:hypothetical protein n=1 Tax=Geosporobacter ferrireducens TaxID=1424294 RepID=UPI00139C541A|nr:hypothetical protein [Geosporobacter ferrireducens]MTI53754.1 hypothetical protein [Geosporobacter ferrireducens]